MWARPRYRGGRWELDHCFVRPTLRRTCGSLRCCECFFFFQAEDGIRDDLVTGVQTCALPISFHAWTSKLNPKVLDLYLYSFDASLRVQLSFLMGQAYATWHRFGDAGMFIYIGLPVVMALVAAGHLLHGSKRAIPAIVAFLVTAPVGIIFYNLFPALGPTYIFGPRFPWNPLTIDQAAHLQLEPMLSAGFRTALPSFPIAGVFLASLFSPVLSVWERGIAMVFVVFTVFATLGSGQHDFIDLGVGCPL